MVVEPRGVVNTGNTRRFIFLGTVIPRGIWLPQRFLFWTPAVCHPIWSDKYSLACIPFEFLIAYSCCKRKGS